MNGKNTMRILRVFLCSTYSDLVEERESVLDAVRRLQLLHDSMEFFGARPNTPLETSLEEIRSSDIVIVIIGHRYGTFVPGRQHSYTELEYDEAWRHKMPCLVYFRSDDVPILPSKMERNPVGIKALDQFKKKLLERHTIANFRGADDLAVQVAADVRRTFEFIEQKRNDEMKFQLEPTKTALKLLDFLHTPFFICDVYNRISSINKAMAEALGYSTEELVDKSLNDFYDKNNLSEFEEKSLFHLIEENMHHTRLRLLHKNGSVRWFDLDLHRYEFSDGPVIQCIARDVTERVYAEQAIKESYKYYRSIAENLPAVVLVIDDNFNICFANKLAVSFFGSDDLSEVMGLNIAKVEQANYGSHLLFRIISKHATEGTEQRLLSFKDQKGKTINILINFCKYKSDLEKGTEKYCLIGLIKPEIGV